MFSMARRYVAVTPHPRNMEARGFEPLTFCLQSRRSPGLSYAPKSTFVFKEHLKLVAGTGIEPVMGAYETPVLTTRRPRIMIMVREERFELSHDVVLNHAPLPLGYSRI